MVCLHYQMRQESLLNFPKTYFFSICSLLPAAPSTINWRLAVTANISSIILESEIILSAINLNLFEKFSLCVWNLVLYIGKSLVTGSFFLGIHREMED